MGQSWIYPSEQMFYNAIKRKNKSAKEEDMRVVVPIHNAVNEESWRRVVEWETLNGSKCTPKLIRFEGKSKSFTLRARWRQLLGYKLPFDRHDWVIDRCGKPVTYIIDYYTGPNNSFFLDVRPYPTIEGIYSTLRRWLFQ
jgi:cytochrome c heme-lyase